MSFAVNFYTFSKKDNSTKQPTGTGTQLNCELLQPSSIFTPYLELNSVIANPSSLNYAYIATYGRYYWVTDWTYDKGFWICRLEVDVLATYKTQIGASTQYVVRAASAYNLTITDTKYPALSYAQLTNVTFDTLHTAFTNGGSFVIGVSNGSNVQSAGITYYAARYMVMHQLMEFLFGGTWMDATDITQALQKELINPMQYIDSIKWYPFDIPNSTAISMSTDTIKFGFWDSGITAPVIDANDTIIPFAESITVPSHPQASRGTYLNGSPYTRLLLDAYGFGQVPIDASIFAGSNTLTLAIGVDVISGIGRLTLRAGSSDPKLFYKQYAPVGVDMKISQVTQGLIGAPAQVLSGAVAASYGNYLGFGAGIVSAIESLMPQITSSGTVGSKAAYTNPPMLIISRYSLPAEDITHNGRPLCSAVTINTLSGYVQCENVEIDIAATYNELTQIRSFLESGFFYE